MKIKVFLFVLLIAFSQSSVMAQRGSTVRGLVSDELGGVIVGATVSLTNPEGKTQATLSDANGTYRFNGVAPGSYSLSVVQTGFGTFQQADISLVDGQCTNPGSPIGNLTSPLFGVSNSLAQFVPLGTGGSPATSNRSVALRAQFNF